MRVETVDFPQYYKTFFGKMVGDFLAGKFGSLDQVDPHLASLTYAGDRWQAKEEITRWLDEGALVLANRYTGANMAFQTARVSREEREEFLAWLEELEYVTYKIPREDVVIFLHVPVEIGQQLVDKKGHRDYVKGEKRDINERDLDYQKNVEGMYFYLAERNNWMVIECCDRQGNLMTPEMINELVYNSLREKGFV